MPIEATGTSGGQPTRDMEGALWPWILFLPYSVIGLQNVINDRSVRG